MSEIQHCSPSNTPSLTRRRWLASASLVALGSGLAAKAWRSRSSSQTEPAPILAEQAPTATPRAPLPEESFIAPPQPPANYEEFLSNFDFRHIQPHEVIQPHLSTQNGIANTLPPEELWSRMPATLFVADEIRERLGRPLKLITSAYRNPTYNRVIGGASRSYHTHNCALDLVYEGGPRAAYRIAQELRDEGFFAGGIGLYRTFIHLDTRGENATWRG